jgi:hypothetical protein
MKEKVVAMNIEISVIKSSVRGSLTDVSYVYGFINCFLMVKAAGW